MNEADIERIETNARNALASSDIAQAHAAIIDLLRLRGADQNLNTSADAEPFRVHNLNSDQGKAILIPKDWMLLVEDRTIFLRMPMEDRILKSEHVEMVRIQSGAI